jgi:Uma2 family endonuclease
MKPETDATTGGEVPAPIVPPDRELTIEELIIDDGEPVDNIYIEKQQRLLTEALYSSWPGPAPGRPFLALSNVGLFPEKKQTPLVPDVMLAVDVPGNRDLALKENRSYFLWIVGKPPDVVLEFVSDRRGDEDGYKMARYARIGVPYYVIFDPEGWLNGGVLRSFELEKDTYRPLPAHWFSKVNLGVKLWQGSYEGHQAEWLRWCDAQGQPIPTGYERAERERQRLERLEAQLRALGIDPSAGADQ